MFRSTKLFVAGLSLATLVLAAPSFVRADDAPPAPSEKPAQKPAARGDRAKMLQDQLDKLNLTDDQKKQIDPIITTLKDSMKTLMEDKTATKEDKMAKGKEAMATAMKDINAVLTPEQQAEFKKMHEGAPKRGGGDAGNTRKPGGDRAPKKAPEGPLPPVPAN